MQLYHQAILLSTMAMKIVKATSADQKPGQTGEGATPFRFPFALDNDADTSHPAIGLHQVLHPELKGKRPLKEIYHLPMMGDTRQSAGIGGGEDRWRENIDKDWLSLGHPGQSSTTAAPTLPNRLFSRVSKNMQRPSFALQTHDDASTPWEQQKIFHQAWVQAGLGPHLQPAELAKRVRALRVGNITPQQKGRYSRDLLRLSLETRPGYYAKYNTQYLKLKNRISHFKSRVPSNHNGKPLSAEQIEDLAMHEMIKFDRFKPIKSRSRTTKAQKAIEETAEKTRRIGEQFENHFVAKAQDISRMSTIDIEAQSRDLSIIGIERPTYGVLLHRYLAEHRKDVVDVDTFRALRDASTRRTSEKARRRRQRAAQQ